MLEGWKCPVCGRGVAPAEKVCDHGGAWVVPPLPTQPLYQQPYMHVPDCGCAPNTVCGSTACPRAMRWTSTATGMTPPAAIARTIAVN